MPWRLPTTLSYAICDGQAVFLDVATGRYFALSPEHTHALELALTGERSASPASGLILAALAERGILERAMGQAVQTPTKLAPPSDDLRGEGRGTATGLTRAALAWRAAARDLRQTSLLRLRHALDATGTKSCATPNTTRDALASIAADFRLLSRVVSLQERCLPSTLAFVRTVRRRGYPASLVFGVRLQPFAAHCWAQHGSLVLNDRLDVVQAFTPVASW